MSESNDRVFCDPEFARRIIQKEEHAVQEAYDAVVNFFTAILRKKFGRKSRFCNIYIEEMVHDAAWKVLRSPEKFWNDVASGTRANNKGYLYKTCDNAANSMIENEPLFKPVGIFLETAHSEDGPEREYRDIPGLRHEEQQMEDEFRGDPILLGHCVTKTVRAIFGTAEDMRKAVHLAVILLGARMKIAVLSFKKNKDVPQPQSALEDAEILLPWGAEECALRITVRGKTLRGAWEECGRAAAAGAKLDDSLAYRAAEITRENHYTIFARWKKSVIAYGEARDEPKNEEKPPCWTTMKFLFTESRKFGQRKETGHAID